MPTNPLPNLFLVGAQKSGTSALTGWLAQHPEVLMSFPKEPGFLAFREAGYPYPDGYGNPAPASAYVVADEARYLSLFKPTSKQQHVFGEASTWYLPTPGMATTLMQFNPAAKVVVILRNPMERAYSAWCHARSDMIVPAHAGNGHHAGKRSK